MRTSNNWIDAQTLKELRAKTFPASAIVFPKIGAALLTNKKRLLVQDSVIDNNVMAVVVNDSKECLPEFLYQWFLTLDLGRVASRGTVPSLTSGQIQKVFVPLPPLPEQRRIAHILSTVQTAIERQARLIALTRELKRALMHKFFTDGLRGEKQKTTEIGLLPESWDVVELVSLLENTEQVNLRSDYKRKIKYIDVSSISREHLCVETTTEYLLKDAPGRARKKVKTGDVIFATVRPTLMRVSYIGDELDDQVCSTAFCVLRAKKDVSNKYIHYVVQREKFIKQITAIESGANYPAVTDRQVKNQKVPKPKFDEQSQIAEFLDICDKKALQHAMKKEKLEELFRTLLHQLMTGQIRIPEESFKN